MRDPVVRVDAFPPRPVRWSFLLFVGALPLEVARVDLLGWSVSWAKLAGLPFLVCYLWYQLPWSGQRHVPRAVPAVAWMGGCLAVYGVTGLMGRFDDLAPFLTRFFALLQLCVFLWVVSDLLKDADLARRALLAYALGAVTWAIGILLRVPGLSVTYVEARLTSLGYDPNYVGTFMALGAAILIGLRFGTPLERGPATAGRLALTLPLLAVVADSGSRTAAVAFAAGLATYLLTARSVRRPGRVSLWTSLGAGVLLLLLVSGLQARGHWTSRWRTIETRGKIAAVSVGMVLERPLLGWGVSYPRELGARMGRKPYVAHNLVLHVLVEVGIVGAVPFLVAVALCTLGTTRKLAGPLGGLPLAVMVTMLAANMALPLLLTKSFWLVLALGAAPEDGHA
jgi:O-antigen ligase